MWGKRRVSESVGVYNSHCVLKELIELIEKPTKGPGFESRWGQELSLLHVVQTGSGAHPASYLMGTGGSFPGGKAAGA
jgi:hypothetical protein